METTPNISKKKNVSFKLNLNQDVTSYQIDQTYFEQDQKYPRILTSTPRNPPQKTQSILKPSKLQFLKSEPDILETHIFNTDRIINNRYSQQQELRRYIQTEPDENESEYFQQSYNSRGSYLPLYKSSYKAGVRSTSSQNIDSLLDQRDLKSTFQIHQRKKLPPLQVKGKESAGNTNHRLLNLRQQNQGKGSNSLLNQSRQKIVKQVDRKQEEMEIQKQRDQQKQEQLEKLLQQIKKSQENIQIRKNQIKDSLDIINSSQLKKSTTVLQPIESRVNNNVKKGV